MLIFRRMFFVCIVLAVCASLAPILPRAVAQDKFTLARIIPDDVFLCANCRQNPERQFVSDYWKEVFDALQQSGIDEDLVELFATSLGLDQGQADEIERLKDKFSKLIGEVDWCQLGGEENIFAERMRPIEDFSHDRPMVLTASLVWVARGTGESTRHNYQALVAILESVVEEANHALGRQVLEVQQSTQLGTQVASLNLLGALPQRPSLPLSVAMRDDLLMIAFREDLRDDVLALMNGSSSLATLAESARFKAAFDQLPPAQDSRTFFDMQALLKPVRNVVNIVFDAVVHPNDVYRNAGFNDKASKVNLKALEAYHGGDYATALALVEQAHEIEAKDSIIQYNLACFNALMGNRDKALDWLQKAVEAGFYGPHKISTDPDLKSLRDEPRYQQALAAATELAGECCAEDVAINFANRGDVRRLRMQVQQAYEKQEYDQALEFIEQAYALAPLDSQVLYALGCLHVLKGHQKKGLDFLQKAVDAGFYCPKQIAQDPDWESVRDNPRYQQALAKAKEQAADYASRKRLGKSALIKYVIDRYADTAGVLDYSATIESTEGYDVRSETITALVADAPDRPIYPVFSQRQPVTEFTRYLPQETVAFSISGGMDPRELYKFIEETLRGGGPFGEELLNKWEQAQKKFGLNIKQDVFELIEGDTINVSLGKAGSVCLIKVSDEQRAHTKVDQMMTALPQMMTEVISQQPAMAALATLAFRGAPLTHESLEGFQNIFVAMSPDPVAVWGTADGFLIFGTKADAVALCLATSRGEHPNIEQNAAMMQEVIVPEEPFVSVSLADHRSTSKEMATAFSVGSMMGGMVAASIPKPEVRPIVTKVMGIMGKLAPVIQKADFYQSVASTTSFDGRIWRNRCVTHYRSPAERSSAEATPGAGQDADVD